MKLRLQSLLFVGGAFIVTTLFLWTGVYRGALRDVDQLNEKEALRAVERTRTHLFVCLDELARWVSEASSRDEIRDAVRSDGKEAVHSKLLRNSTASKRWDFAALLRPDCTVVARLAGAFSEGGPEPAGWLSETVDAKVLGNAFSGYVRFVTFAGGQPILIAISPIRYEEDGGTPAGYLVAGRCFGADELRELGAHTDSVVSLLSLSGEVEEREPVFVSKSAENRFVGCSVLVDGRGDPIALLRAQNSSHVLKQVDDSMRVSASVFVLSVVFLWLLIDRLVLRRLIGRLARLGNGLRRIQQGGRLSERLNLEGGDELTALTQETNRLLASVESSHAALERANAEMQQRVAERTAALADANAALEADIAERIKAEQERERLREQLLQAHKMEAVGTLAGGIAHDFNNILTGILGHAQLLDSDVKPGSPAASNLKQVVAAAERATSLVKQILAFSRQTPGERRPVSAGQVTREALALLRAALPAGISIRVSAETQNDTINADPTQLHQVLMNLGANAGHAMGAKGGELIVRIERARVREAHPRLLPGEYVRISVRDTGCGMTAAVMDRIFDPFFSTKPVNEGTGLGLAVVHGIVVDHGGAIDVESKVGTGTCFHVWLPAASDPISRQAQSGGSREPMKGSERVLLVDDEEIVLSVLTKGLTRLGYEVAAATTGQKALAILQADPDGFDLVITDQTMPLMSGLQLNTALKAIRSDIPVILATGYSPDVEGREAPSLNLAGIVTKPIHFSELTKIMRVAIDRSGFRAPTSV